MPRPLRLCLILHSTRSDNLGVGALTVAEVEILREAARDLGQEIEIEVMDWKDPRDPYIQGNDVTVTDMDGKFMIKPGGYFAAARRADIVIDIGAGDSFADIYGSSRLNRMWVLKFLTHIARTPMVLAPQTIGPFKKPVSRFLARLHMRLCRVVASRDALSTQAARDMGVTRDIIEASDVALRLPFDAPARPEGPPRVGLNVSGLLMAGGYSGQNDFGLTLDYPGLIRKLIAHFQGEGAEVHLVSHVIVPEGRLAQEDDYRAAETLAAEIPGLVLAPKFASPSEAKSYIAGLDFFAGARMHACIAAFSSGVPVIPMAYSRKFAGLFGSIGYARTVDCTTGTNDDLFATITAAYADRATLKAEAETALAQGREKLGRYEAAVKELMRQVSAKIK